MLKISACVVLYNPTLEVIENVATYADKVDHFIVVDNSDTQQHEIIETLKSIYSNLIYIDNRGNLGIATALNIACDCAIAQNSDWILTMDQDSKFINFQDYLHCLHSLDQQSDIALLAPNTGRFSPEEIGKNAHDCTFEEHFIVITSGNFLNLNLFNSIGRFDDNLFIDVVDYDYCAKVKLAGYKTLLFKNILLEHQLGVLHKRKNLLTGKIKYKTEHSPQRAYYIARNYLYLARKYRKSLPQEFALLKVINIVFIHDVTKILLYEDQKCKKISAKFLGAYHFMIGKYGKYTT
ncbi:MAG: glycosyltransferase [Sulfuricurvum sp.]|nr:glycosyltransferase [Sulfuricurvum sp.]